MAGRQKGNIHTEVSCLDNSHSLVKDPFILQLSTETPVCVSSQTPYPLGMIHQLQGKKLSNQVLSLVMWTTIAQQVQGNRKKVQWEVSTF